MSEGENDRQYNVIDQMLTAHALLRDRYGRRALLLNVGLLAAAIAMNAFVFAGDDVLVAVFGAKPEHVKVGLGIASVVAMILSIMELRVDWAGMGRSHAEAAERLGRLKARFRECYDKRMAGCGGEVDSVDILAGEYNRTMAELPPIPDKKFLKLKAAHHRKRLLSREISAYPAVPVVLLSLRLRWRAIRNMLSRGRTDDSGPVESKRE